MAQLSINQLISSAFNNPYPVLAISEENLGHNFNLIRKITGESVKILIPVKANAYGAGIDVLMPFFNRVRPDFLGVANPFEGALVRSLGWEGGVLNLGGFYPESASMFMDNHITPSITDLWQVEVLDDACRQGGNHLNVHIKLDLGMGRIGIQAHEIAELVSCIKDSRLRVTGIFTHFPSADVPAETSNEFILSRFSELSEEIMEQLGLHRKDVILHAANSASMMLNPESHLDMVRPGIGFYGYFSNSADLESLSRDFPFKPSLRLLARPISVRHLKKGATVSYGETYRVESDNFTCGVIPIGYADGIPRELSGKISFNGHPLLGRVTMDQIILGDVDSSSEVIEILGESSPPLEKWADICRTISYEIMVKIGDRIARRLI